MRTLLLATTAIVPIGLAAALANPQGGQVVGGTASIAGTGTSNVTVTQTSNNAVINWNTFNIGRGETTRFIQPSSSSSVLNRVTGDTNPSQIYGTLSANGRVFVINPNGVLIGNGAVINTAGFLATTHDISNADFMAGRYNFSIPGNPQASVVNLGTITATNSGFAALVAPGVRNAGVITATFGKVALASANGFSLDLYGDKLITIGVNDSIAAKVKDVATGETLKSLVQNEGRLQANGGLVQLTAAAARTVVDSVINTSGVIEARSIGRREGRIVLGGPTGGTKFAGSGTQTVKVSGKLDVSNKTGKGGKIEIVGENIVLTAALLDASGKTGGGKVLIGGDVGGGAGNAAVAHLSQAQLEGYPILTATTVSVDAASHIDVSAKESGDGGKVVVWSDGATVFNGTIAARGGSLGGNGGFAEVSGKQELAFTGLVDRSAPHGQSGTLLLDPDDYTIDSSTLTTILSNLALGDVVIQTTYAGSGGSGDINVNESFTWGSANTKLTLSAYRDINFATGVVVTNTGNGNLILRADNTGTGTGTVTFADLTPQVVSTGSGNVNIFYNPTSFGTQDSSVLDGVSMGSGALTAYMLVNDVNKLQDVKDYLTGTFALGKDIDANATAAWNSGAGFVPIGQSSDFTGVFDGNGYVINRLTINRGSETYVGLFGTVGTGGVINNVRLTNASVTGEHYVGALAGRNLGTIDNSSAAAVVSGGTGSANDGRIGGLVGYNLGAISNSFTAGSVAGGTSVSTGLFGVGGLVGYNDSSATIVGSYSSAAVSGGQATQSLGGIGGLAGINRGSITYSYATGTVYGGVSTYISGVGGLVGSNDAVGASIGDSYATGNVNGGTATLLCLCGNTYVNSVGGLVGFSSGTITYAYALGGVTASDAGTNPGSFGGLVGGNQGTIDQAYATGSIGVSTVLTGGLVGYNAGTVTDSFWDIDTTGKATSAAGTGLLTADARTAANYTNWNFGTTWYLIDGQTRPFLASEYSTTVTNAHQLQLMSKDPSASYTLANSIDLTDPLASVSGIWTAAGFVPVGDNGTPFTGSFNGGGYAITGLTINRSGTDYVGLFGRAGSGSTIQNVNLIGGSVTGQNNVGSLVGSLEGTITNVSSSATVVGQMNVGGLVGNVQTLASVDHAYSSGSVTGYQNVGGLVGWNAGAIEYAYATGAVGGYDNIGGLVGHNDDTNGTVEFTYSSGAVSGSTFDLGGGLIGSNAGSVANSYWDTETSGQNSSEGGDPLTTAQARTQTSYSGWNFSTDWYMVDGQTRPILRSESSTTITNLHQLQLVALNPSADYKIANDFNAAELASNSGIWASTGFVPIATFSGTLDGQGYTVADLKIAPTANNVTSIGLFGAINSGGVVKNLTLDNIYVVANSHPDLATTNQFIGGLAAFNFGTIEGVTVNGTIDGGSARAMIGGIVGMNGNFDGVSNGSPGMIRYSSATVDITSTGNRVQIGGIAGYNSPSSTIADTFAVVDIAATGTVAPSADCSSSANCEYINVGGLVGFNQGTIQSTFHWPPNPITTYAQGTIDVGQNGVAGGLVAQNEGFITYTYADVALTGAAGDPGPNQEFDNSTTLGGLAGTNRGLIVASYALGNVGNVADYLTVGGFVGDNAGTISDGGYTGTSYASGNVTAGNHSEAGGFAANSAPDDFFCSSPCTLGDAFTYINTAFITNSSASGDVTVGHTSLAGGFAGFSDSVSDSTASGAVSGGDDSVLGGFAGAVNVGATISGSSWVASPLAAVTGTGANSWIGGFAGVNAGRINGSSSAAGAVEGGSQSLIGGFAGLNVGQLNGVTTAGTSTVEGTGTQNVVGGLVGANLGWIRNSTANGDVTTGAQTTAGSLVGANGQLANVAPGQVPYSTFAVGVIQSSVGTGTVNGNPGPQIGSNSLSSLPAAPGVLERCDGSLCDILKNPVLVSNENPDVDNDLLRITQVANIPPPPSNTGPLVLIQLTNPPGGGTPGSGGPPAGTSNNNVPPGTPGFTPPPLPLRSVPSIDGERFSSIPPPLETRFFNNEVVVQISSSVSPEELARIAQELGLTMVTSQNLGTFGRTAFRFRFTGRQSVRAMIRALEQRSIIAIAQPNYQFRLMQPPASLSKGDPAQYMLNKLQLAEVHKTATGKGVIIAVIDSEVDKRHTELQGTIGSELDTVGVKEPPHSHGTAMAGAIVSRDRLLGVAPDARILAVRAFGETNNSADGTTYNILKGIEWAVSQGARVINMSFAGPRDPSIERALKAAREKGVVLVAAAGNAGPKSPPLYPGADPSVIAVTATDAKDLAFRGANRGAQLSVAAPGVDVLAPAPDETYQMSTGTSIATAHISGVIALMLERDPSLTPQEIRTILEATATDLGPRGKDSQYGWGLVNPKKALDAVVNRKKTSDAGKQAR